MYWNIQLNKSNNQTGNCMYILWKNKGKIVKKKKIKITINKILYYFSINLNIREIWKIFQLKKKKKKIWLKVK